MVANAGVGALSTEGGPTRTHPLLPGSPAIDTALPGPCGQTDQRGMSRSQDGDGNGTAICDKGPFEFNLPLFADVPAGDPFAPWIEEFARRGLTGGCAPNAYCPADPATRAQLAVFLVRAFGLGF